MRIKPMCSPGSLCTMIALCVVSVLSSATGVSADIVMTKDGREIRGIVIEEYKDRILFSTVEGEKSIMKSDIKELFFDDEEMNLIKLGEQAMDRRRYMKAVGYYGRALKINPESKAAKDNLVLLQRYLSDRAASMVDAEMKRMDDINRFGSSIASEEDEATELKKAQERLAKSLGMSLDSDGTLPTVRAVRADSPADDAGIRKGDAITAVWGRLTGYMSIKEVIDYLMEKASAEIHCTVERTISVPVNQNTTIFSGPEDIIGAALSMEFDGLTLTDAKDGGPAKDSGLKRGDRIVAIDGVSTRYMPLKKAIEMIKEAYGSVALTVRRDVIIWRRDQQ